MPATLGPPRNPSLLRVLNPAEADRIGQEQLIRPPVPQGNMAAVLGPPRMAPPVAPVTAEGPAPAIAPQEPAALEFSTPELRKPRGLWGDIGAFLRKAAPVAADIATGVAAGSRQNDPFAAFSEAYRATSMLPYEQAMMNAEYGKAQADAEHRRAETGKLKEETDTARFERESVLPTEIELKRRQADTQLYEQQVKRAEVMVKQALGERYKRMSAYEQARTVREYANSAFIREKTTQLGDESKARQALQAAQSGYYEQRSASEEAKRGQMPQELAMEQQSLAIRSRAVDAAMRQANAAMKRADRAVEGGADPAKEMRLLLSDYQDHRNAVLDSIGDALMQPEEAQAQFAPELEAIDQRYGIMINDFAARHGVPNPLGGGATPTPDELTQPGAMPAPISAVPPKTMDEFLRIYGAF